MMSVCAVMTTATLTAIVTSMMMLMQASITQNLYFKDTSLSSLLLIMFSKSSIFSLSKWQSLIQRKKITAFKNKHYSYLYVLLLSSLIYSWTEKHLLLSKKIILFSVFLIIFSLWLFTTMCLPSSHCRMSATFSESKFSQKRNVYS